MGEGAAAVESGSSVSRKWVQSKKHGVSFHLAPVAKVTLGCKERQGKIRTCGPGML